MNQTASMNWANKKVLVTGGAGFVGSHLVEYLLAHGAEVTVVDNLVTGKQRNIDEVQAATGKLVNFIHADVSQPTEKYLPTDYNPEVVLHFASPASPPKYQRYPVETYQVNAWGCHNLLTWLKSHAPQATFVFASTSEIYGDPLEHPQKETQWGNVNPNGIRSCYDEAKRLGETICGVFHREFNMDTRIARIFNTYGPRIDIDDGRVIPNLLSAALKHQPLPIYGDGKQTRSYCYVTDLVRGILTLAASPNAAGETFNIGNPDEHTILETAEIIQHLFSAEQKLELTFLPLPKDDPIRRRPDISKIQQSLSWQPTVSFEEGLKLTAAYFQQH